jgi:transcriptional regulator with XRE-family HTH domain
MRLPPHADLLAPLGRLIEGHRLQLGYTQAKLASYCRVSMNTVGNLEAARHRPTKAKLMNILQMIRSNEDVTAGVALPVLRAPRYEPTQAAAEARRVLLSGGLFDPAWACVCTGDAGSWLLRASRDEIRIAELQAPLPALLDELERGQGPRLEQLIVLGHGAGHQVPELVREAAARTALQSVWLIDPSPLLLVHGERAVGQAADAAAGSRKRRGQWGAHLSVIGVQALCADHRDQETMQRLFRVERGRPNAPEPGPSSYPRLVYLNSGVLDMAADDWRDLGAAAALIEMPGDMLLLEHRMPPLDDPPDTIERARAEWWSVFLQESANLLGVRLVTPLRSAEPLVASMSVPTSLPGVVGEDRVAKLRQGREAAEHEIRLHWRRAYEPGALDTWLAAHGLRLRGRWPYRFGSRCWALFERAEAPQPSP